MWRLCCPFFSTCGIGKLDTESAWVQLNGAFVFRLKIYSNRGHGSGPTPLWFISLYDSEPVKELTSAIICEPGVQNSKSKECRIMSGGEA
jgi:hypothetical protein